MTKWLLRLVASLALVLAVGGCEPIPTTPSDETGEEHVDHDDVVILRDSAGNEYEAVLADLAGTGTRTLELEIDSLGGSLTVEGHTLVVPRLAVLEPTLFTLQVFDNGWVEIELTATRVEPGDTLLGTVDRVIDVGALGFLQPVTVEISYAYATNVTDATRLVLLRVPEDDPDHTKPHELIPTTLDAAKGVLRAQLDHFTKYCLASN